MNKYANNVADWYGVKKDSRQFQRIALLVKTQEDSDLLNSLIIKHGSLFFGLGALRNEKIKLNQISEEEFESDYKENAKTALENLFQDLIYKHTLKRLNTLMDQGKITLSDLYNRHNKRPGYRLGSFLL